MLVHGDKLRWLAWLRVKMLVRGFQRRPSILVLSIIGGLVLLFAAGSLSLVLFLALTNLSPIGETEVLYLLFSAVLLFWIVLPLLSYSTNEGLDITKLQLFPLTRLEVMFSLLFSSLFDIWTVFLFVLFGATIVAWWAHSLLLGLMALLVLLVFYVTMVGISQLVLALMMRTLQSRRFRDLSILLIALFSSSCYLLNRFAFGANGILTGSALDSGSFSPYLQWLPSGVAAGVLRAALQDNWTMSFGLLGLLLAICVLALYLWQQVLERSMSASESGASRRAKQGVVPGAFAVATPASPASTSAMSAGRAVEAAGTTRAAPGGADSVGGIFRSGLFNQLEALVKKELLCFWRDPLLKARIFQSLIYLVIVVVINLSGGHSDDLYDRYLPFIAVILVFFFMLTISLNTLGIERQSLSTLFLFPLDRRRLLWGKNIAVALMGLTALLLLLIASVLFTQRLTMLLPALVIGLAGVGVTLGCANMIAVFFPRYQPAMGRRSLAGSGNQAQAGGCLNQVMSLGGVLITAVLLVPVALGIGIPFFINLPIIWIASMPLSLLYGLGLYIIGTNVAARHMLAREPEILAMTTRE